MPAFEYYMSDSVQQWLTPLASFRSCVCVYTFFSYILHCT